MIYAILCVALVPTAIVLIKIGDHLRDKKARNRSVWCGNVPCDCSLCDIFEENEDESVDEIANNEVR